MGDNKYITQTKYFSKDIEIMSKLYVEGKTDEILKMYPNMTKQNLQNVFCLYFSRFINDKIYCWRW